MLRHRGLHKDCFQFCRVDRFLSDLNVGVTNLFFEELRSILAIILYPEDHDVELVGRVLVILACKLRILWPDLLKQILQL